MNGNIEYSGVYLVSFTPSVGHEYQHNRPAVVIEIDNQLKRNNLVTVMPLTSQTTKPHSDDILVKADNSNKLFADSLVKVHHIQSFDHAGS
ncbi:MAG TPA: type II toxin-antitoxin system PemK/MazF family toxin [Patescibacteria group bacterium]